MNGFRCLAVLIALSLGLQPGFSALAQGQPQGHGHDQGQTTEGTAVPVFNGLGDHHFPITTNSEQAQQYFDQGLMFIYGFNHFEATRSFAEAVKQDPRCAMCYWGISLALGPHINAPMFPDAMAPAYQALKQAQEHAPGATEREQAYIKALAARYQQQPPEDRTGLDRAYAEAMRELAREYPDDLDAATLFAESLMNLVPWNYWDENGQPRAETAELVQILDTVLEREPYHPGALHYHIHALENSPNPERAEGAADRLRELNVQIGHMIHMPSHIYARVGRWHDASSANEGALAGDKAYLASHEVQGMVPLLYHPHNFHFLSWTAGMEGRSTVAYQAARELVAAPPAELANALPFLPTFLIMPPLPLVRFGKWDDVLALPRPPEDAVFLAAISHYARGLALAAKGDEDQARQEAAALQTIADSDAPQALEMPQACFPGGRMIAIANNILQAEI
ncbi:MAG: hypothetical protein LAT50_22455, partial [Ectothiorhodospiraceae bacterium]|nr:hypothetical protein [Ectothiorhodospiraceae bacterium]